MLQAAINNELKTHELYMTLRDNYIGEDDRDLFKSLADEELAHKSSLEKMLQEM